MTIGVESRFTSALGLRPPWAARDARLDTARGRIDVDLGCAGATLACPACGAGSQPVRDRIRHSWRHLDLFDFETWLHCDVPRVACGHCGRHTDVPVPWARSGAGYTAAFEALALALCVEGSLAQAARLLRCNDTSFWGAIAFHANQARDRGMFLGRQSPGIDGAGVSHGVPGGTASQDLGHDLGIDPGTDRGIERPPWSDEGRGPATLDAFIAALKAHGGDPESTHRFWLAARAAQAQADHGARGLILALAQARTGEDRFRALALAMDAMVPVLRVPLRGRAVAGHTAAPQAQHGRTLVHRFMHRAWAWGTRRWTHPARLDAYGTSAAIRHDRFMPVAAATSHRGLAVFGAARGLVYRVKAAWDEFRSALYFVSQSMGHTVLRSLRLTRVPADPLMLAHGARLWGRPRRGFGPAVLMLLIPVLGQAAVQNLIFFSDRERVRALASAPPSRDLAGLVTARVPGLFSTERAAGLDAWASSGRYFPRWVAFDGDLDPRTPWMSALTSSSSFEGEIGGRDAFWRQWSDWNDALQGPFDAAWRASLGGSQSQQSFTALGNSASASGSANIGVTSPVPEPGTLTLALAGAAVLASLPGLRRRLQRH